MNSFERFQKLNQAHVEVKEERNANFVFSSYPSTTLVSTTDAEKSLVATVVNKQEKDLAYIYTRDEEPLDVGSIWSAKGLTWLISDEIVVIHNVKWHKYLAFLCNIKLGNIWGFFIGPEKKYIGVQDKFQSELLSQQKPVIVLPDGYMDLGDRIVIKGRPWLVQEYDNISTDGVTYYSLAPTTASKEEMDKHKDEINYIIKKEITNNDVIITPTPDPLLNNEVWVSNNVDITLETSNYAFHSSKTVDIITLDEDLVTFRVPFGVNEVEIKTSFNTILYKIKE